MCQAGRRTGKSARRAAGRKSVIRGGIKNNSSKLTERSLNVHENKGALWKTRERSWNVYENKEVSR
jgi:hypothetical protein